MTWEGLIDRFPYAYYNIGMRYLLSASIAFLLFYVIFRKQPFFKKIQPRFPQLKDYRRDIGYSVVTVAIFSVIGLITFIPLAPYTQLYTELTDQPIWYWMATVVPLFFLHDFYFYWTHRLMHHRKLFRHLHRVHHLSTNPSPWTAYAFHPLESVLEGLIIPIMAFTVPTHRVVIVFFMIFQIIFNVYAHLGYELFPAGFHKTRMGRYLNTSVAHNQHHHHFTGNFGLYTLIWDRLFGTLRTDYDHSYDQAKAKTNSANA